MYKVNYMARFYSCKVIYWFSVATKKVSLSCGNQDGFFANLITAPPTIKT